MFEATMLEEQILTMDEGDDDATTPTTDDEKDLDKEIEGDDEEIEDEEIEGDEAADETVGEDNKEEEGL